ncbi:serine/arginine-rich splicing factor 11-like [Palaemon carinicauda]|uniref:serine/arginine-rich splicing factor 11-like n=1 Tax=Palaemon carinicauda TaxID=392227 RepID=UPI0035B5F3DB
MPYPLKGGEKSVQGIRGKKSVQGIRGKKSVQGIRGKKSVQAILPKTVSVILKSCKNVMIYALILPCSKFALFDIISVCRDVAIPVQSHICFIKFHDRDSVAVAQHLTNTVFIDRALIIIPFAVGGMPDEQRAMEILSSDGTIPGIGQESKWPTHVTNQMVLFRYKYSSSDVTEVRSEIRLVNHSTAAIIKPQTKSNEAAQRDIEEAMRRVKEAQNFNASAIDPVMSFLDSSKDERSRSRSRLFHKTSLVKRKKRNKGQIGPQILRIKSLNIKNFSSNSQM